MSVCTFSAEELANVAHVMLDVAPIVHPDSYPAAIDEACRELALVSQANVACYNDRYSHLNANATARTAEEIKAELIRIDRPAGESHAMRRALSTARLLHYNCDDQGGDFTLKVEGAHAALISILEALACALARKAGLNP